MNLPLVAIIGRVNVGKSTLFNRLTEERKALVSTIPGTTRDLNFGVCQWQRKKFRVVDTGGIFEIKLKTQSTKHKNGEEKNIATQVETRARKIIDQADLILFVVDTIDGILNKDRLIAQLLKNSSKPVLLVANKTDNQTLFLKAQEFKKLGLGEVQPIAAVSGKGIGDLLDTILKKIKKSCHSDRKPTSEALSVEVEESLRSSKKENLRNPSTLLGMTNKKYLNVSIIGKPNVGKSSLLNKILGEDHVIVSPIPHTTREPQDTYLEYEGQPIKLIDTAGIRRKNKVHAGSLEAAGINMSIATLKKSDIALFVLDSAEPLTAQDAQLANLIVESGVSVILVGNKYDLFEANKDTTKELTNYFQRFFPFLTWAPIIFVSAKSGRNCQKILSLVMAVAQARSQKIPAKELSEFFDYLKKKMPPPRQQKKPGSEKKARAQIKKLIQKDFHPPVFAILVANEINVPEPYLRYLENNLRDRFKFLGTPLKIVVEREVKLA
jgi:GTP-binding protein